MWPEAVTRQFGFVPQNPSESDFHGPYNKLSILFSPASRFVVVPQCLPDSRNTADFNFMFEVLVGDRPVLIVELKPPNHLALRSKRKAADDQIRTRLRDLVGDILPPGHSARCGCYGTSLAFYSLDTKNRRAAIIPAAIARDLDQVNDTAPVELWAHDVLDAEGEGQLRAIVEEIKTGCEAL